MEIFRHHIYEYKKGLRNLVLYTGKSRCREKIEEKLEKYNISYLIKDVSNEKINVFFGDTDCINVLKTFGDKPLYEFTDEEDFILGIMLGYCRKLQCKRFLRKKAKKTVSIAKQHCKELTKVKEAI